MLAAALLRPPTIFWLIDWLIALMQYRGRRCVTADQCRSMTSSLRADVTGRGQAWKARDDGVCDVSCPPVNDTESLTDPHLCVRCIGSCPKGTCYFSPIVIGQMTLIFGSLSSIFVHSLLSFLHHHLCVIGIYLKQCICWNGPTRLG